MATKKIDEKKTLKYAVAFYFCTSGKINFMLGNKMYQHINTVYDQREDGRGFNTCEVVYNYKAQKYCNFIYVHNLIYCAGLLPCWLNL